MSKMFLHILKYYTSGHNDFFSPFLLHCIGEVVGWGCAFRTVTSGSELVEPG